MKKPIVKIEHLDFVYNLHQINENLALKDINLEIKEGEYVAFLGPSGCGKSTLLYTIAGIDLATRGKVEVNNKDLSKLTPQELAEFRQVGIGMIFQNFNLIPSINVLENVMMPMAFISKDRKHRKEEARKLLKRLGLEKLEDRFPFELSGGQQQRVGIARALINQPPIMFADEPLGNLDSANAEIVLKFLNDLNKKEGKTVVMVTHEEWSLRDVDRIFHMRDGVITKIEDKRKNKTTTKIINKAKSFIGKTSKKTNPEEEAKKMTNLILRGYTSQEINRFEKFLADLIRNKIDMDEFVRLIDKPYKEGGVGLWKQKAVKIGKLVQKALDEEMSLKRIYDTWKTNPEAPLYDEIRNMRYWLLEGIADSLDSLRASRIDEAIAERMRGIINREHFFKIVDMPVKEGGVGFNTRESLKISDRLETLLSDSDEFKPHPNLYTHNQ